MSDNLTLSWDDEIDEGQEFKIVPDGDYEFEVSNFERGYYEAKAGSKISSQRNCSGLFMSSLKVSDLLKKVQDLRKCHGKKLLDVRESAELDITMQMVKASMTLLSAIL